MPAIFDPNAQSQQQPDQFDFEARKADIEQRRQLLAALMRRQVETQNPTMPEGKMVGGRFIAPNPLENLNAALQPLLARVNANSEQKGLQGDIGAYDKADQQAAAAHVASRPQGRPELPGPQAEGGSPELAASQPSTQDVAAWAQKGATIPSRRDVVAKIMADMEVNAPARAEAAQVRAQDREDRQAESRTTLNANLQLRREQLAQQAEEARQRSEDNRASIEQRREAAREHADLMAQLAADRRADKANAPGKPLPNAVHKELSAAEDNAATMSQLKGSFDDSYSGMKATIRNAMAPYDPTGTIDDKGSQWWKQYRKQVELTERHALFGASLTPGEQASWASADINQSMKPQTIRDNLATRERLANKVFANAVDRYEKGGYPNVRDAFDPSQVRSTGAGASGSWDAPTPAVRVNSAAEAAKLKPGTRFMTPDGQERVRQ